MDKDNQEDLDTVVLEEGWHPTEQDWAEYDRIFGEPRDPTPEERQLIASLRLTDPIEVIEIPPLDWHRK